MKQKDREELIRRTAVAMQEKFVENELKDFWRRFRNNRAKNGTSIADAIRETCSEIRCNRLHYECTVDEDWITEHKTMIDVAGDFESFEGFMRQVTEYGACEIKLFKPRNLTEEEQRKAGSDYKPDAKEENILRPFSQLSAASRRECICAAIDALYAYEELTKRGATMEQLKRMTMIEVRNIAGTLIHLSWLRRNEVTDENEDKYCSYEWLDHSYQRQYLKMFEIILQEVEKDPQRFAVQQMFAVKEGDDLSDFLRSLEFLEFDAEKKKRSKFKARGSGRGN